MPEFCSVINKQIQLTKIEGSLSTNILTAKSVINQFKNIGIRTKPGEILPCRALGHTDLTYRLKAAWLVFTGKADALLWELE